MGNYGNFTIKGNSNSNEQTGYRVSGIGDINGDGIEDVAVSAERGSGGNYETDRGAVYIVYGHEGPDLQFNLEDLDGSNGFKIESDSSMNDYYYGTTFGSSVTGLGDVNGDGVDDFAIVQNGTSFYNGGYYGGYYGEYGGEYGGNYSASEGVAYVIYGGSSIIDVTDTGTVDVTNLNHARLDASGEITEVVSVGDVNGDGINDIALNTESYGGYENIYNRYYYDENNDGVFDPDELTDTSYAGRVATNNVTGYVVFGVDGGFADGSEIADRGNSSVVTSIEELDGTDGFSIDAGQAIGAASGGFYGGEVFLTSFNGTGIGGDFDENEQVGVGIQGGADLDGDGFSDVLVNTGSPYVSGASYYSNADGFQYSTDPRSEVFVFERGVVDGAGVGTTATETTDISITGDVIVNSEQTRTIGDVSDDDNLNEVGVIGFARNTEVQAIDDAGMTFVTGLFVLNGDSEMLNGGDITLAADDLGTDTSFYFSSLLREAGSSFGAFNIDGVTGVGDMTGDGIDDFLVVGTMFTDANGFQAGGYLVAGSDTAQSGVIDLEALVASGAAYRLETTTGFNGNPIEIAAAGDFNDDGATDIIFGDKSDFDNDGSAMILFGGAALEAVDNSDGTDDNILILENTNVDVDTGLLPIRIGLEDTVLLLNEGTGSPTDFAFTITRTGDLTADVSVDFAVTAGSVAYTFYTDANAADFEGGSLPSGTVTFASGEATATIVVQVAGDTTNEGTEDFTVNLSNPTSDDGSAIFVENDRAVGLIANDDQPVTISIFAASSNEGDPGDDNNLEFTITRSGNTTAEATVEYSLLPYVSNSIAAESEDLEDGLPQNGSVTFAAGETSKTIVIPILEDNDIENGEYVTMRIDDVLVADGVETSISRSSANAQIINDDFPVTFTSTVNGVTEQDGTSVTLTFTVTRSGVVDTAASVDFELVPHNSSVTADDFDSGYIDPLTGAPRMGTLEFASGETVKTVSMEVAGDNIAESTEYVRFVMSNPTTDDVATPVITTSTIYGRIDDDDIPVYFSAGSAAITEGDPGDDRTMTFQILRSGKIDVEATISYDLGLYAGSNAADADDFTSGFPASGDLTFAANETSKSISVVVTGDDEIESFEYIQMTLSDPATVAGETAQIANATSFGTIYNDDQPMIFAVNDVSRNEGDAGETTDMNFRVFRSGDTTAGGTVDYSVQTYVSSQAADVDDFDSAFPETGTLTFAAGETFKDVTVTVQGDDDVEANEFFQVVLSNAVADDGTATQLSRASAFGTILNDDVPVQFNVSGSSVIEGQGGATTAMVFTVFRSGNTQDTAQVDYDLTGYFNASRSADAADFDGGFPTSGTLMFAAGETSHSITLQVLDDSDYENTEYVEMHLSNAQTSASAGAVLNNDTATGAIIDNEQPVYFRVYGASTTEGEEGESSTMAFLVSRSGDTSAAGSVDYEVAEYRYGSSATSDDFVDPLPQTGTLNFAAGETTQYIEVVVAGDNLTENTEYFEVLLSEPMSDDPNGRPVLSNSRAYGYIYDDDLPVYFRVSGSRVTEGETGDSNVLTFQITRDGETNVDAQVDFSVAGGTAEAADFDSAFPLAGTLSFAAGETSKTVSLLINPDDDVEGDEYTYLNLSNAQTSASGVNAQIASGRAYSTIVDDDFMANVSVGYSTAVTEGDPGDDAELTFVVSRSGDTSSVVTLDYDFAADGYSPIDASDFEGGLPQNGSLTFAAGETQKTVTFRVAEDDDVEGNERGLFTISNVQSSGANGVNVTRSTSFGTIFNDDYAPRIIATVNGSQWGTSVNEGNSGFTPVDVTFSRDGDDTGALTLTYDLLTNQGSVFGADSQDIEGFLPSYGNVVEFEDGETSKIVTININGDGLIEANESFQVKITDVEAEVEYELLNPTLNISIRNDDGRPPIPELPFDVDGDGVIEDGEFIRVEADVFGDPHIVTLDGLGYDFQAVGEYVLVETEDQSADNAFSVQVRFEAFPGSDLVSVTTRMAVEVNGVTIELDALGSDELLIDGNPPSADDLALGAIDIDGDGNADVFINEDGKYFIVLNDANEQLMVGVMEGSLNVCVFLAGQEAGGNAGAVRGLMGNANQDFTDDFGLRDGSEIPGEVISFDSNDVPSLTFDYIYGFGEFEGGGYRASWAIDQNEALFSGDTPDYPENFPAAPLTLDNLPTAVREAAEQAARDAGLDPDDNQVIFENAVLDFALTGMGAFLGGATQLAADPQESSEATDTDDTVQSVSVSAELASLTEGDDGVQTATFTFYRVGGTEGALEVSYSIGGDVDADDLGVDTAMTGTVSIADGQDSTTLDILVKGDLTTENDEALRVSITGTDVEGMLIAGSRGETTIVTDDFGPVAQDDAFSAFEHDLVEGNVFEDNGFGADSDADGDTLMVTRLFDADLGEIEFELSEDNNGDFSIDLSEYDLGLGAGEVLQVSATYEITDGNGGLSQAEAFLTIQGVNDGPNANDDEADVDADTASVTIDVLGNDSDPDTTDVLTISNVGTSSKGSFAVVAGQLVFTLGPDFENLPQGETEDISVTYTVSDGDLTDDATVVVTVAGTFVAANQAPVANDDVAEVSADAVAAPLDVLSNDSDPEGVDLMLTDVGLSAKGFFTIIDGQLVFTPGSDFANLPQGETEDVSVTYTVSDGELTDEATVVVTVMGTYVAPNQGPNAVDDTASTDADNGINIDVLFNDTDPENDDLDITQVGNIANKGTFSIVEGEVVFNPGSDFAHLLVGQSEDVTVDYTISDGDLTDVGSLTVTVLGTLVPNTAPEIFAAEFEVAENGATVGNMQFGDADGDDVTFSISGGADAALFQIDDDGLLSFIDAPDFETPADAGGDNVYNVEVSVSDSQDSGSADMVVTVVDVDEGPVLNTVTGTDGIDRLMGTNGDDVINSLGGRTDVLTGLAGSDVFDFSSSTSNGARETRYVTDFQAGEDMLDLGDASVSLARSVGNNTYLFLDEDRDIIILQGVSDFETDYLL